MLGITPIHMQDFALWLAELHEIHVCSLLKTVKIPLALVLAAEGLIFFTLAGMELCIGFRLETGLTYRVIFVIAEQCLHRQGLYGSLTPIHERGGRECTRRCEDTQM